ncbi:IS256 family transposase [bacterium]|nr:MAG: IS256 family transposase [bacterium]
MKKVPPSQVTREQIAALLAGEGMGEDEPVSLLVRLAVKRIVEEALEGVVRDLLGREYYARRGESRGYRNGYRKGRLATGEGEVSYAVPQVREVDASAIAELRERLSGRTEALEKLAIEMYARGCSTRDIQAIFADEEGRSLLSRTAVSEVTEALWEEYEAFVTRDLSGIKPLFLFLDGIAEKLRAGARCEAVLAAWCITWEGKKVLVHLAPGSKESTECAVEFLEDCRRRGLADPILVVTDGAAGLMRAVETCFPASLRQRCLAHKMRNIAVKLPDSVRVEFTQAARAAYQAPSPAMARVLRDDLVERYQKAYPTAVRCLLEDFEACIAHLACPPSVRKVIRTANLLERLFEEERRRTKTIHSFFGERPVLKLMYASVIRASDTWRGIRIGELEYGQLERLREQLIEKHREATKTPKNEDAGSAPSPFYSTDRT